MSDALSDIARDEERGRNFYAYLESAYVYLTHPTKENLATVIAAAEKTDSVSGGYWGRKTDLSTAVEERLARLIANDIEEWSRLMAMLMGYPLFGQFKALSPFKDKMLLLVDYGCGFVTLSGELQEWLNRLIRLEHNMKTYDSDKYMVALPMPDPKDAKVTWLRCGILGIKGPRKAND